MNKTTIPASTPPAPAAGSGITAKFREAMAAAVALGEIDEDSARYAADVLGCVVMDASESIVSEVLAVLCPEGHDPEEHDQVQEAVVNGLVGPAEPPAYGNRDSTELEEDARTAGPAQSSERPFDRRAANALAYECAKAVRSGRLDARSGIADALLDYLDVGAFDGPTDVPSWMLDYERNEKRNAERSGGGQ